MSARTSSILLVVWILSFTLSTVYGFTVVRQLIVENRHRINDIKETQIQACVQAHALVTQTILIITPLIQENTPHGNQSDIGQRITYLLSQADPQKCYKQQH